MIWNDHKRDIPEGAHAPFGASQSAWVNYQNFDKFLQVRRSKYSAMRGTIIHAMASDLIDNRIKVTKSYLKTQIPVELLRNGVPRWAIDAVKDDAVENLLHYINDGIGFGMKTEQPLKYSDYFFGTTDCIIFDETSGKLRIHDYKNGTTPAHIEQLYIYAALFCLEYGPIYQFIPGDIQIETRLYQTKNYICANPTAADIVPIMDIMVDVTEKMKMYDEEV